ncbi:hypothetical protein [Actinomadura macrotermitis]|uniref:Protein kinase domain-containing protein n=1 Tax=Actinomadura macrotermitis TaxID=2585200 RepID=A0A7K0BPR0_9ACTN|nr:hypothetical protein [Actinomadura macrotermitis]MQY03161.1 hypothetical protein [Actinomadura macrotermitis]
MSGQTGHHESIGPYRLLAHLGGAPGVYRAADPGGRDVAIRKVSGRRPDIEAMRGVLSPYVVDVLDGDPGAYVVSRLVPGAPLERVAREQGPLRGAALRRLALGLAKGLAAIHRAGLAHGDLRPGTVLMVDGAPVIVDFALTPGTEAGDVHAWAATVTFAATAPDGAPVPEPLVPLLRAATAPDPAARPSATELADAVAALDLGPDPARPAAPARPAPVVPAPAPPSPPQRPAPTAPDTGAHTLVVAQGWARLLAVLVVVVAVAGTVTMPVAGIVLSLCATAALRLAGPHGRLPALGRTLATLPFAAAAGVAVSCAGAALALAGVTVEPLAIAAGGAAAGVAVLWLAPGAGGPRRRLERILLRVAGVPHAIAAAGVVLGLLAFLAVVGAMSLAPSFAPMYGLQSELENTIGRLQGSLR